MVRVQCPSASRVRNLSALTHRSRDLVCDVRQTAHHTIGGLQHITHHTSVCVVVCMWPMFAGWSRRRSTADVCDPTRLPRQVQAAGGVSARA
jgi:hypothetical protein